VLWAEAEQVFGVEGEPLDGIGPKLKALRLTEESR
jgi:hypothetical protein